MAWLNLLGMAFKTGAHIYKNRQDSKRLMSDAQKLHAQKLAKGEIENQTLVKFLCFSILYSFSTNAQAQQLAVIRVKSLLPLAQCQEAPSLSRGPWETIASRRSRLLFPIYTPQDLLRIIKQRNVLELLAQVLGVRCHLYMRTAMVPAVAFERKILSQKKDLRGALWVLGNSTGVVKISVKYFAPAVPGSSIHCIVGARCNPFRVYGQPTLGNFAHHLKEAKLLNEEGWARLDRTRLVFLLH